VVTLTFSFKRSGGFPVAEVLGKARLQFSACASKQARIASQLSGGISMQKPITCLSAIALLVTTQSISIAASDIQWDLTVLPRSPQPFEGVAQRTLEGSVASFTEPVKPPADAPNILLVLIDDAGFG